MASIRETKCPSCGVESGPCIVVNGQDMYHEERKLAAYPTNYEYPDCKECRQLKDKMVRVEYGLTAFGPTYCEGKPQAKWTQAFKDEYRNQEMQANMARMKYESHLMTHK